MNTTPFSLLAEVGQAALESLSEQVDEPVTHNSADALNEYADAIAEIATDAPADADTLEAVELALEHYGVPVIKSELRQMSQRDLVNLLRGQNVSQESLFDAEFAKVRAKFGA